MKGKHRIILETDRIKYDFTVKRNITVILGDSATGKTTLVEFLGMYASRGKESGVKLQSDVPCVVYSGAWNNWQAVLKSVSGSIVFIDEDYSFIFSKEFAEAVRGSDNYYVLITRRPLYNLPYSLQEIYGIRTSGKYSFPEKIYQEFYPVYSIEECSDLTGETILLVEDTGSGLEFFEKSLTGVKCIGVGGNTKLERLMSECVADERIIVIADGAAFGAFIENVLSVARIRGNTGLYFPESFEWMILKSGILKKNEIREILDNPEDYIDGSLYFSWERFFTYLLEKETKDDYRLRYAKDRLPVAYLADHNKKAILDVLPDDVKEYLYLL